MAPISRDKATDPQDQHQKRQQVARVTRAFSDAGIMVHAYLMYGFPGETVRNTVHFIQQSKPTYYRAELYYHGVNAPIHARREEFGLKGAGFSWSHDTMSWQQATQHIVRMYQEITESVVLPVYNYDFWGIPYLLGQGLSKQQIY